MDPRGVPVAEISTLDLEICGVNGRPTALCGVALPVVRHKDADLYALYSLTEVGGLVWEPRSAIDEHCELGRLTLLSEPLEFPHPLLSHGAWSSALGQTLVAWVEPGIGQQLGWGERGKPEPIDTVTTASWQLRSAVRISREFPDGGFGEPARWFCAAKEHNFEYHFKSYATQALSKCDEHVVTLDPDWSALKWLADFGLSAAVNHPDLRYPLYVRYCAAMYFSPEGRPESTHNVFKLFVNREFPTVTWDRFREDMRVVVMRGKDVAAYRNGTPAPPVRQGAGVATT